MFCKTDKFTLISCLFERAILRAAGLGAVSMTLCLGGILLLAGCSPAHVQFYCHREQENYSGR
jgi:hypothetical protein